MVGNEDVLSDIGFMLENLTNELDAMLLPSDASFSLQEAHSVPQQVQKNLRLTS